MRPARLAAQLLMVVSLSATAAIDPFARPASVEELKALLAPAQSTLAKAQALRGKFEQRKYLSGVPQPLVSEGEFTFARERGVWWHTRTPFESELILTRAGIVQRDAGGTPLRMSAEQQPALRIVADVFLSLFSLDPRLLAENFQTYGAADAGGWVVGLVPRAGTLGGAIARVTIHGRTRVERIELEDRHGDRTAIVLADDGRGAGPLSDSEAARFGADAAGPPPS